MTQNTLYHNDTKTDKKFTAMCCFPEESVAGQKNFRSHKKFTVSKNSTVNSSVTKINL